MNKYKVTMLIMLTCLLTACGYHNYQSRITLDASGQAVSGGAVRGRSRTNSTTQDVTSGSAVSGGGIYSSYHVSAQMQQADYWIDWTVSPDKVLMDTEEIAEFNKETRMKLSADDKAVYFDLEKYGESMDRESLEKLIGQKEYQAGGLFAGEDDLTEEKWDSYVAECNMDAVADSNKIRYGVICSRADVRMFPTTDNISDTRGDTGHDIMQYTALAVNEPVLIVHESKDGQWYYVIANEYAGWILRDRAALCKDREEWNNAQQMDDFIVVTGDEILVRDIDGTADQRIFTMGTKLALAGREECGELLRQRNVYDNYIVKIPVRMEDGQLDYQYALVPLGKDVSHGYLEYTKGNVLRQAFKLLGNPYGWGGMNGGRDCSSMTRDIYLCFGFRLPRDAATQAMIPGKNCISLDGMSGKEKREKVNSAQPGTILQMPGHVMIYLGCQDRHYYVISANGTFIPDGGSAKSGLSGENYQTRLVTVNALGVKSPSSGKTWGEQITAILGIP